MPEILKAFLKNLNDKDAEEVWLYLDGDPRAISDMIEFIVDSHLELSKRVCGN